MKRFRALSPVKGNERVDRSKGIIYGVAVNAAVEAKGHGVWLEEEFVNEVTQQGNLANGLKCRLGHPTLSGDAAIGTYAGRLRNFRTEFDHEGIAVSKADLHLSQSAKSAPKGDLFTYILDMAENDPDQFGMSIAFEPGKTYRKDGDKKIYQGEEGFSCLTKTSKTYATLKSLYAADVVDTPAATRNGLFSEFTKDFTAAKVTEFLDNNPDVQKLLFSDDEVVQAFLGRYEFYKEQQEEEEMNEEMSDAEVGGFFKRLFGLGKNVKASDTDKKTGKTKTPDPVMPSTTVAADDQGKDGKTKVVEPQPTKIQAPPEAPKAEDKKSKSKTDETNKKLSALEAKLDQLEEKLSEKDQKISELETALSEKDESLKGLGVGFSEHSNDEDKPEKKKNFNSWDEAMEYAEELCSSYDEAFDFCVENYGELYPIAQ